MASANSHPHAGKARTPASTGLSLLVLIAMVVAGTPSLGSACRLESGVPSSGERGLIRQVSHTLAQVVRRAVRLDRTRPAALLWHAASKTGWILRRPVCISQVFGCDLASRIGPLTLLDLPPPPPPRRAMV